MALNFRPKTGTQHALINSLRTTVVTVVALLLARLLRLPESYWAAISSIVILLSTMDRRALAWQRFMGTALGAVLGAVTAIYVGNQWIVYGAGIFVCGLLSVGLRLAGAYRFAAITLTIVLLANHGHPPWTVAWHRFVEVSLGIAVALIGHMVWPLEPPPSGDQQPARSPETVGL